MKQGRIRYILIRVLWIIALVAGLTLSPGSTPQARAAADIYVRPGGDDTNCNGTVDVDYSGGVAPNCAVQTIQQGIDLVDAGGTVHVAAGTYDENLVVDTSLTIIGAGVGNTLVDGGGSDRVFLIGSVDDTITANISNLTIQNGAATDVAGGVYSGGGIRNQATLTLNKCEVISNTATYYGGGIINTGTLTITKSTISNNTATGDPSGMGGVGGGIFNVGTSTITRSTISGNAADAGSFGGDGGGIQNGLTSEDAELTMTNCTVSGNTAGSAGGGIENNDSDGAGGGTSMTLTHVTITDNQVTGGNNQGGGIFIYGGTHVVRNSIIYGNTASVGDTNIMRSTTNWTASHVITTGDADPLLGPLQDNGGSTETHAFGAGSSAIDAGDDTYAPNTDQRGIFRPLGDHCDIGAVEASVENIDTDEMFCTIQSAIDDADTLNGHTISVGAGTYDLATPIEVDKPLSLIGDPTTPSNVVVNAATIPGYDKDGFRVMTDSVTIQGFRIQGASQLGSSTNYNVAGISVGLDVPGIENTNILDNEITDSSYGIYHSRSQHTTIARNTIWNIHGDQYWAGKGIQLFGAGTDPHNYDIQILDNEIYECDLFGIELNHWQASTARGEWIDINTRIANNTIHDNGGPFDNIWGPTDCGRGISSNGHDTGVTITGNEIYNHWGGDRDSTRIYPVTAAIRAQDSKDWVVTDNDIHDNMRGILFYGNDSTFGDENTGYVITANRIYNNAEGIAVGQGGSGDVGYAHNNDIYNNVYTATLYGGGTAGPYGVINLGTDTFDAENNWWGSVDGPEDISGTVEMTAESDCTTPVADMLNAVAEESGSLGDSVSENVDYCPWSDGPTVFNVYLPLVMHNYTPAPDLVIEDIITTANQVQVVIKNAGDQSIPDDEAYEFWIDLYLDPDHVPAYNEPWQDISDHGAAWGITWSGSSFSPSDPARQALPLEPGEVLTLTTGGDYYWASESDIDWPLSGAEQIYAQVDSINAETTYGGVEEQDETNNVTGPATP